jgi:hypothetical protein
MKKPSPTLKHVEASVTCFFEAGANPPTVWNEEEWRVIEEARRRIYARKNPGRHKERYRRLFEASPALTDSQLADKHFRDAKRGTVSRRTHLQGFRNARRNSKKKPA